MNTLPFVLMKEYTATLAKLLTPKLGWISVQSFAGPIAGIISGIVGLIHGYVYDSAGAVLLLVCLYLVDWGTGVFAAAKQKQLVSRKLGNILISMVFGLGFLTLSRWFGTYNPAVNAAFAFFGSSMAGTVYFILTSQLLLSIAENACKLGWLPPQTLEVLQEYASIKRWFKKKDKEPPNQDV